MSLVELEQDRLLRNLRSARRNAAGGPSGMTADHGRPLLDSERDAESFCRMCEEFARAQVSDEVAQALRMGRMTALQKSSGGIRGIVVGGFVRRLVARTLAQQLNPAVEQATSPFQFELTTKWVRMCRSQWPGTHRSRRKCHSVVSGRHRGIRLDHEECRASRVVGGGRWRFRPPFCPTVLRFPINLLVG